MAISSPLNPLHQQAEATFLMYGSGDPAAGGAVAVVESFGELEAEYAALRKGCVLLDLPYRGVIEATGRDRLEFLNRMVTQELKGFAPSEVRRSFWLNRRGRIDADLRMVHFEERTLIDLDVLAADRAVKGLAAFLFSEEAAFEDASKRLHRLGLHGPTAAALLQAVSAAQSGPAISTLQQDRACRVTIGGADVSVFRDDSTGEPGYELIVHTADVPAVYQQLLERGLADESIRMRTAGWHAYNIARIEAGRPVYNIDFGPESLVHECGETTLRDRVSFTKGCYLGQEIVARMQSLGHPKQVLVGLKIDQTDLSAQAETGTPVFLPVDGAEPKAVGAVTSSTRSPMLGDRGVCFAQVRWDHRGAGTRLTVRAGGTDLGAVVQPTLTFWSR